MKKLTVALLAGGISSEREVSLQSGDQVYEALDKDKYDILAYDPKTDLGQLAADAARIDVALIIIDIICQIIFIIPKIFIVELFKQHCFILDHRSGVCIQVHL